MFHSKRTEQDPIYFTYFAHGYFADFLNFLKV